VEYLCFSASPLTAGAALALSCETSLVICGATIMKPFTI
jgi:hypothetical protein